MLRSRVFTCGSDGVGSLVDTSVVDIVWAPFVGPGSNPIEQTRNMHVFLFTRHRFTSGTTLFVAPIMLVDFSKVDCSLRLATKRLVRTYLHTCSRVLLLL